jgi:hypothetical protein
MIASWKMTGDEEDRETYINALSSYSKFVNKINSNLNIGQLSQMSQPKFANKKKDEPCWDGYEMVGMKDKDGKPTRKAASLKRWKC